MDHIGNMEYYSGRYFDLGSTTHAAATVQRTQYYPSGLPWKSLSGDNPGSQPYKFNGCEFIEMHGLDVSDLGNRAVYHAINRFTSIDRFAEKFPWQSPYVFAGNKPVNYIDVNGDSVNLSGPAKQSAFDQAQMRMKSELKLILLNNGTINATQISTDPLSSDAQQFFDAVNSSKVFIKVITTTENKDSNGNLIVGGGFGGNIVKNTSDGNIVEAIQTINPQVLQIMNNAHGTPGKDVIHEITEAYQGALISQKSGKSSPASNQPTSVYIQAHNAATPQSGTVTQTVYTTIGTPMPPLPGGRYQYPIGKVEWSVINTSGVRTIIQTLR